MSDLKLISHHLCPYVQRAAISLAEKAIPHSRRYVDLANKPDWFLAVSPLGKTPVLIVEETGRSDTILFESAVILEYLEDTRDPPLHPADPLQRAEHRAWIEFGSAVLAAIWRFYSAPDEAALRKEADGLSTMFARLEAILANGEAGPWFAGKHFSLVDAVFGPVFRYFDAFDRISDFGILDGKPGIAKWRQNLADRPSVRDAVAADYPDRLMAFLEARRSALSLQMV